MTERQQETAGALLMASIFQNLGDKTFFTGLADFLELIHDPTRNAGQVTGRLAESSAVPSIIAQAARAADPVVRATDNTLVEARATIDGVKARIPGVSQTLPAKRDVFGEAKRRENLGPDMLSPFPVSRAKNDALARELQTLAARVAPPTRTLTSAATGKRERLSTKEYSEYQALSRQLFREGLRELVAAPDYRSLTPDERRYEVDQLKRETRKQARQQLFGARFSKDAEAMVPPPPGYQAFPALNGLPTPMRTRLQGAGVIAPPSPPPGFMIDPPPSGFVLDQPRR